MINAQLKSEIRERAQHKCEYCQLEQQDSPLASLQIEHIIPRKHGGLSRSKNLALACIDCNLHKGANLTGIDPDSNLITPLFHPREQSWEDHFEWHGPKLYGKTDIGRTTIRVLNMNSDDQVSLRSIKLFTKLD
ncbi:MAG TPA: hypothetical protein DD473_10875 [Planctomycetaceae bacterium]|nr:hypothetical protein [Planctomycetaceae bacterium]|tara:strand:- start:106 stop:507 length:402 start_codon:yes stop_codon:yes gene_type:complete